MFTDGRLANCDVTRKRTYVADRNGRDAVTLSLEYEHEPATVLELLFGQPSADAQRFALIARERLASLPLPAEVCALRVRADRTMQASTPSGDLFGDTGQEAADAFLLLARLRARLGDSGVIRLSAVCTV